MSQNSQKEPDVVTNKPEPALPGEPRTSEPRCVCNQVSGDNPECQIHKADSMPSFWRDAINLCHSESNRWAAHDLKTSAHWKDVAALLEGEYLARRVRAAAAPVPVLRSPPPDSLLEEARAQRDWLIKECERIGVTVNVRIGAPIREAYALELPAAPLRIATEKDVATKWGSDGKEARLQPNDLHELTAEICETVDWPEFHRVDATQSQQVRAILERFMAKHYEYEDALVAAIPKMMQQTEREHPAAPLRSEEPLSAEKFWEILWGEEAFKFKDWATRYASIECPITPSRFNEALQRLNAALASRSSSEGRIQGREHNGKWNVDYEPDENAASLPHPLGQQARVAEVLQVLSETHPIASGSGRCSAVPCFDEFDYEVENKRTGWVILDHSDWCRLTGSIGRLKAAPPLPQPARKEE